MIPVDNTRFRIRYQYTHTKSAAATTTRHHSSSSANMNFRPITERDQAPDYVINAKCHPPLLFLPFFPEQIPVDAPWNSVMAEEWDNMTTSEWLDKICWFSYTKKVAEAFARTVFATETYNMSLLFFLWYVKNGGGKDRYLY